MSKSSAFLRNEFYEKTDIRIRANSKEWKAYALWLEKVETRQINIDLIRENKSLRKAIGQAMDVLGEGISVL